MIDTLTARYGTTVVRRFPTGAALQVTAPQLAALRTDPSIGYLSDDAPVRVLRSELIPDAIGADQVWHGTVPEGAGPGYTGKGITIAVIDSGIANVKALQGRVIASKDFTARRGRTGWHHRDHHR